MNRGSPAPESRVRSSLWAVVLAGGEGIRLQPLTRRVTGDSRPKQFCELTGSGTLLEETVRRVARLIPRERQLLSLTRSHAAYYEPILARWPDVRPVIQPASRGTALGVLYPALHVTRAEPSATIAVFPSDHCRSPRALRCGASSASSRSQRSSRPGRCSGSAGSGTRSSWSPR